MAKNTVSAIKSKSRKASKVVAIVSPVENETNNILDEIAAIEASLKADGIEVAPMIEEAAPAVLSNVEVIETAGEAATMADQIEEAAPADVIEGDSFSKAAAAALADKEALRKAGEAAALASKRDATADRAVTTPAHHALVIARLGNVSEPARMLLIDCAGSVGVLERVLRDLEAHGKAALATALETLAGNKSSSSAFTNNMIGMLSDYAAGKREFSKLDFAGRYNTNAAQGARFSSPLKAFMRQLGSIEVERGSSFTLKADDAAVARLLKAAQAKRLISLPA